MSKNILMGIAIAIVLIVCVQVFSLHLAIASEASDRSLFLHTGNCEREVSFLQDRIASLLRELQERDSELMLLQTELSQCRAARTTKADVLHGCAKANATGNIIPSAMSSFLHGVARIRKDDFLKAFDYGLPGVTEPDREAGQSQVLLLYNTEAAVPSWNDSTHAHDGFAGPLLSVDDATKTCPTLNVVSIGRPQESSDMFVGSQCLALVGHEQMYHIQRFVRNEHSTFELIQREAIKEELTGKYASRYQFEADVDKTSPAQLQSKFLEQYLPQVDTLKSRLKPILENVASNNTVVAMVCNQDQSSLLHNFACSCRAKGIANDNVVVFPTDKQTERFAQEIGFATFYDEEVSFEARLLSR